MNSDRPRVALFALRGMSYSMLPIPFHRNSCRRGLPPA